MFQLQRIQNNTLKLKQRNKLKTLVYISGILYLAEIKENTFSAAVAVAVAGKTKANKLFSRLPQVSFSKWILLTI